MVQIISQNTPEIARAGPDDAAYWVEPFRLGWFLIGRTRWRFRENSTGLCKRI